MVLLGRFTIAAVALERPVCTIGTQSMAPTSPEEFIVWHIDTVHDHGDVGKFTSLALDADDQPHITYLDEANADLKHAWFDASGWHIETVDNGAVRGWNSLRLDSADHPYVAYGYVDFTTWADTGMVYAYHNGTHWITETVDSEPGVGFSPSLALDGQDRPHISYRRGSAYRDSDLKYAQFDGNEWQFEIVDDEGGAGWYTSMELDSSARPHIAYFDNADSTLNYAWFDGSEWHIETIEGGRYTSLALDSADRPHISYAAGPIRYAHFDGSSWITQTVDSEWGRWTSIALDTGGQPHVSYQSGNELRYGYWDGSRWNITVVDQDGVVGSFSSLSLDSANRPHISYYDETNKSLKYAHLAPAEHVVYLPLVLKAPDLTPPFVVSTDPPDGATDVSRDLTNLFITFSEPMNLSNWSVNYGGLGDFDIGYDASSYTFVFTRTTPGSLLSNWTYTVTVNQGDEGGFVDLAGNRAPTTYFSFTTED